MTFRVSAPAVQRLAHRDAADMLEARAELGPLKLRILDRCVVRVVRAVAVLSRAVVAPARSARVANPTEEVVEPTDDAVPRAICAEQLRRVDGEPVLVSERAEFVVAPAESASSVPTMHVLFSLAAIALPVNVPTRVGVRRDPPLPTPS